MFLCRPSTNSLNFCDVSKLLTKGYSGNGGLSSYYGYQKNDQSQYRGGGNLGYGYYDPEIFPDRNVRPQYQPSGYRGYN